MEKNFTDKSDMEAIVAESGEEACLLCRFWKHKNVWSNGESIDDRGTCRRNAPHPFATDDSELSEIFLSPSTHFLDWCGQFEAQKTSRTTNLSVALVQIKSAVETFMLEANMDQDQFSDAELRLEECRELGKQIAYRRVLALVERVGMDAAHKHVH